MNPPAEPRSCWILTDGKIGMVNQCLGLARALGLEPDNRTVDLRAPWRWLPPSLVPARTGVVTPESSPLAAPWPDILIASGRKSVAPARAVRVVALERREELATQGIGQGVPLLRAIQRYPSHAPGEAFFLNKAVAHGPSA